METNCIFCAIINQQIPATILYQDESFLAFSDIHPLAPVHILIIPKAHFASLDHVPADQPALLGELLLCAQKVARQQNLAEKGYRLMINTGKDGGQTVPHLHIHLLGGNHLLGGIPNLPVQVG
jgi:histidine triad (HIT) family protein